MADGTDLDSRKSRAMARVFTFEPVTAKIAREALLAGLGGTLTIGVLAICARIAVTPLIIAPFGASCVLLFAVPASRSPSRATSSAGTCFPR
jgi:CBS-domain-containing membrane protein